MTSDAFPERDTLSEFLNGMRHGVPVTIASMPFGLLFGALAVQQGFSVGEAMLMSATIYAGASQMVGLELFGQNLPAWMVVSSIFAVNFRHILYSAVAGPHITHWAPVQKAIGFFFMVDPQFAETERHAEQGNRINFAWYMGVAAPVYVVWVIDAWLGATFGGLVPDPHALGIDFLLPIYFLGLVMGFRSRPLWLPVFIASGIASILAYKVVGSPWHVSIGAAVGILLAAAMPLPRPEPEKLP